MTVTITKVEKVIPELIKKEMKEHDEEIIKKNKTADKINMFKQRDKDISSRTGLNEINFIFEEIDDGRSKTDLHKVKVMEFGCGSGKAMELLHERGIRYITGIDMDSMAIRYCIGKKLKAKIADATKIEDKIDIVYGIHILESVNFDTAVKMITNSLKIAKKAIFVISVNAMGKGGITKLFRAVPNERHRRIKGIVKYTISGTPWQNDGIVFYRKGGNIDVKSNNRKSG